VSASEFLNAKQPAVNAAAGQGSRAYRISGLDFASEVVLPGAIAVPALSAAPDVVVRRSAAAIEAPAAASTKGPNWAVQGERFFLQVPRVARFLITGGRQIEMFVEPGVEEADAVVFLLGTALGILLYQRGQIVLHASAVLVGGRAVLFTGRSGAGKSTLAAALDLRGYPIINDDVCRIDFDQSGCPLVLPDGKMSKLWQDAVDHLGLLGRKGAAVRGRIDKYYIEPKTVFAGDAVPLGLIYSLREHRPPFGYGVEPLGRLDAAQILRRNLYRQRLVSKMGLSADLFSKSNAVQDHVETYRLTRPFDLAVMPDIVSRLEAHWSSLGLKG
jgi:hypothetical protein